ncbi:MAG TPA: Rrf2 family transcriptional regulator, partial [Candidatus Omnitrophota bacterium]|nr:Rrf2 family transcriptional regulator [Candidatus Omnitrophota bacterium]
MRLITKNTDYAVRALVFMGANQKVFVSARQISEAQGIPYQFLRRILNELILAKLVISKEGVGGGFRLALP